MAQREMRTYQRRSVTRESGYHTCDDSTGGECIVIKSKKINISENSQKFIFFRKEIKLIELFQNNVAILAFGGYIYIKNKVKINYKIEYNTGEETVSLDIENKTVLNENDWNNVGFHLELPINSLSIFDVKIEMLITSDSDIGDMEFISFDFNSISKTEFYELTFKESFFQKTNMSIPMIYYLNSDFEIDEYLLSDHDFVEGNFVILKSCNRCGRYLPINIHNEMHTLSFSLHCKKNAPCKHSTFRAYQIKNDYDKCELEQQGIKIDDGKVISYYGHQLECKACKKFFVNKPLNPQRNPQQFKEDGLRRRAIEVLVNLLLEKNLVHFEFEKRTKSQFSEYIWKKFNCKCFKCKKDLKLSEMNLDHTMPLAYLYRLDESATCLCGSHNSQKSDHFPVDYYTQEELVELSEITGIKMETLSERSINLEVLDLLIENIVWFYDEFLMNHEYQKVREGILTADKINDSLKRVINGKVDLAEKYKEIKGHYPKSITIIQ